MRDNIEQHVRRCVNGASVAAQGTALVAEGEPELEVPEVPLRWDPTFLLPMLWDGLVIAWPIDDLPAHFEARQVVYDEQRRESGSAGLVAEMIRDVDKFACRGQFVEAVYRLETGERVVAVDERRSGEVVTFGEDRGAVVITLGLADATGKPVLGCNDDGRGRWAARTGRADRGAARGRGRAQDRVRRWGRGAGGDVVVVRRSTRQTQVASEAKDEMIAGALEAGRAALSGVLVEMGLRVPEARKRSRGRTASA